VQAESRFVRPVLRRRFPLTTQQRTDSGYEIDVIQARRRADERFVIRARKKVDPIVLNIEPKQRHLLLQIGAERYLCGHDERHWFVAGVPTSAKTVREALLALRPEGLERPRGRKSLFKRRTKNCVRQGEWFFIPAPDLQVPGYLILTHEPIRRGRNQPHVCQELYRTGGETVVVCPHHPNGITLAEWEKQGGLTAHRKAHRYCAPQTMQRNATAYVRGKVSHPDHATIVLHGWHRVVGNLETTPEPMAFLD
jgi:hypothetical protein